MSRIETEFYNFSHRSSVIGINSLRKAWWDTFMDVLVAYSVITTLYFLGFDEPGIEFYIVDQIARVFFIADIVLHFFSDFVDARGSTDHSHREIAANYFLNLSLTSSFFVDFIAVIPFREMGQPDVEYFFRLLRVFKIPATLNLIDGRAVSLILREINSGGSRAEKKDNGITTKYITDLITLVVVMLLLCYGLGCFWWWYVDHVRNEPYTD